MFYYLQQALHKSTFELNQPPLCLETKRRDSKSSTSSSNLKSPSCLSSPSSAVSIITHFTEKEGSISPNYKVNSLESRALQLSRRRSSVESRSSLSKFQSRYVEKGEKRRAVSNSPTLEKLTPQFIQDLQQEDYFSPRHLPRHTKTFSIIEENCTEKRRSSLPEHQTKTKRALQKLQRKFSHDAGIMSSFFLYHQELEKKKNSSSRSLASLPSLDTNNPLKSHYNGLKGNNSASRFDVLRTSSNNSITTYGNNNNATAKVKIKKINSTGHSPVASNRPMSPPPRDPLSPADIDSEPSQCMSTNFSDAQSINTSTTEKSILSPVNTSAVREIAQSLYDSNNKSVNHIDTASWLGDVHEGRSAIRKAFMELFNFTDLSILSSIRVLCERLYMKAESQQLDRIVDAFAERWCQCNPNHKFMSVSVVYTLAYSILLLNTDLHSEKRSGGKKMVKSQYIQSTLGAMKANAKPEDWAANVVNGLMNKQQHHQHTQSVQSTKPIAFSDTSVSSTLSSGSMNSRKASGKREAFPRSVSTSSKSDSIALVNDSNTYSVKDWESIVVGLLKIIFFSIEMQPLTLAQTIGKTGSGENIDFQNMTRKKSQKIRPRSLYEWGGSLMVSNEINTDYEFHNAITANKELGGNLDSNDLEYADSRNLQKDCYIGFAGALRSKIKEEQNEKFENYRKQDDQHQKDTLNFLPVDPVTVFENSDQICNDILELRAELMKLPQSEYPTEMSPPLQFPEAFSSDFSTPCSSSEKPLLKDPFKKSGIRRASTCPPYEEFPRLSASKRESLTQDDQQTPCGIGDFTTFPINNIAPFLQQQADFSYSGHYARTKGDGLLPVGKSIVTTKNALVMDREDSLEAKRQISTEFPSSTHPVSIQPSSDMYEQQHHQQQDTLSYSPTIPLQPGSVKDWGISPVSSVKGSLSTHTDYTSSTNNNSLKKKFSEEELLLHGSPWGKEGLLKVLVFAEGFNEKRFFGKKKSSTWTQKFVVVQNGYLKMFQFGDSSSSSSGGSNTKISTLPSPSASPVFSSASSSSLSSPSKYKKLGFGGLMKKIHVMDKKESHNNNNINGNVNVNNEGNKEGGRSDSDVSNKVQSVGGGNWIENATMTENISLCHAIAQTIHLTQDGEDVLHVLPVEVQQIIKQKASKYFTSSSSGNSSGVSSRSGSRLNISTSLSHNYHYQPLETDDKALWALLLPNGGVVVFEAGTKEIADEFIYSCNYWAARVSKEPLIEAVTSYEYGWDKPIETIFKLSKKKSYNNGFSSNNSYENEDHVGLLMSSSQREGGVGNKLKHNLPTSNNSKFPHQSGFNYSNSSLGSYSTTNSKYDTEETCNTSHMASGDDEDLSKVNSASSFRQQKQSSLSSSKPHSTKNNNNNNNNSTSPSTSTLTSSAGASALATAEFATYVATLSAPWTENPHYTSDNEFQDLKNQLSVQLVSSTEKSNSGSSSSSNNNNNNPLILITMKERRGEGNLKKKAKKYTICSDKPQVLIFNKEELRLGEWVEPFAPLVRSNLTELSQMKSLVRYRAKLECAFYTHVGVRALMDSIYYNNPVVVKCLPLIQKNWEAKAKHLMREVMKYGIYTETIKKAIEDAENLS